VEAVTRLMNRYSVWEEAELVTGCIHKWHKLQKRKHADVREQIGREMGQLWSRLREGFFWSLVPEVGWPTTEQSLWAVGTAISSERFLQHILFRWHHGDGSMAPHRLVSTSSSRRGC
jgi:hypothetical protein